MFPNPLEEGGGVAKGEKIRIGCLTIALLEAHKREEMLCHRCSLHDPQQRRQKQNQKKNFPMVSMTQPTVL